jgi:hypothetical protein
MSPAVQPCGTARNALRKATIVAACAAGCARGNHAAPDASGDAAADDAPHHAADGAVDSRFVAPDAASDAGCAISDGMTIALDGTSDLAKYPSAQHIVLGAMMGGDDAALAWDREELYITVASPAFSGAYEPLHVYIEAAAGLGTAVASQGKEYSGLVPQLAFTPTHLVAVRRVSDSGTGAYDAVYTPASTWSTRALSLVEGSDVLLSADGQTLSVRVPWSALGGCPTSLRVAAHVVHAVSGNEWKDLAPSTHTPWLAPGGGYYEIDLTGATAVASWAQR